ncbi:MULTISPECIES: GMC family oxidoreductase N-terminal domain-containing protein [unclassified Massilia]|uniref:GMC family oxidoreductase N-terminal domain-containing protein n=1 Tax=unclassified Massilia TaxID=2609279 RepID=UPI001B841845|nr:MULTISPECIES: GMC family oxidoreductase N-terminal domain-containing protein [unclassified Massilia]MBQ5940964.1 GMC family oxidoreductase [Massilia sp. AB1]MBQ5963754.1 GMC family oxidoreductase [Massilia sp. ZL223]
MDADNHSYDAIVVGTGPGGASVARELARAGSRILILEQGGAAPLAGTLTQMAAMAAVPGRGAFVHRDASLLVGGATLGGSTAVNFATAAPPPGAMFAAHGIDLDPYIAALRAELPMAPLPDHLVGPMAARIAEAARAAGFAWRKLDKMIRPQSCRSGCWRCVYGCPFGAKWTARDFVEEARRDGAVLASGSRVLRVLVEEGRARGVEFVRGGQAQVARAPLVVLAGGGIGSPRILHRSGLGPRHAPFFSDPVVAVMGSVEDLDGGAEVPMAAGAHFAEQGIALADLTLPRPMYQAFAAQVGRFDRLLAHRRTLSVMVKIRDEIGGAVGQRWADKRLAPADKDKLRRGTEMARAILRQAGARNVFSTWHFAAHPGGSVRIGAGVDAGLETGTPGLFVCDASVIPEPWGLPPTLTLLALGKRLGQQLAAR